MFSSKHEKVKANPSNVKPCSTSLVGNSVIDVDQLYDKPLTHFDPSLASEIEVGAEYFQTDFEGDKPNPVADRAR